MRVVIEAEGGRRFDVALSEFDSQLSRSQAQRLIRDGVATVNGRAARPGYRLTTGDVLDWVIPEPEESKLVPEDIPLDIVYEDAQLIVVNKPAGMVVHPAPGHPTGTLVNAVLHHCAEELPGIGGEQRPGLVHRLDRDTSGLIMVAKTEGALRSLQSQLSERTMHRRYLALVLGNPTFERAEVDAPIGRDPRHRQRMAVLPPDSRHAHREAFTEIRTLERFPGMALLEARLRTGRTHQVRVHCAYIRHPVLADPVYGPRKSADKQLPPEVLEAAARLSGQALHAWWLAFTHPTTEERLRLTVPPPEAFLGVLRAAGSQWTYPDAKANE